MVKSFVKNGVKTSVVGSCTITEICSSSKMMSCDVFLLLMYYSCSFMTLNFPVVSPVSIEILLNR